MPARKKTDAAKIRGGNSGRKKLDADRDLKFKPVAVEDFKVPPYIEEFPEALAVWNSLLPRLVESRSLFLEDATCFGSYCLNQGIVARETLTLLRSCEDLVQETLAGNSVQHPRLGIIHTAERVVLQCSKELGLTPASRGRVGISPPQEGGSNPFAGV